MTLTKEYENSWENKIKHFTVLANDLWKEKQQRIIRLREKTNLIWKRQATLLYDKHKVTHIYVTRDISPINPLGDLLRTSQEVTKIEEVEKQLSTNIVITYLNRKEEELDTYITVGFHEMPDFPIWEKIKVRLEILERKEEYFQKIYEINEKIKELEG